MQRHAWLAWMLPLVISGLTAGCSLDPADCPACQARLGDNGGQDTTELPAGELGGECLADGTCGEGLTCVDDVCTTDATTETLLIFHNNTGPMCMVALAWLEDAQEQYPTLVVEEHLTTDADEADLLDRLADPYPASEGVSTSFQYLPIIFFKGRAFSGFDDEVQATLEALLQPEGEEMS
jgi:hypothetical protein